MKAKINNYLIIKNLVFIILFFLQIPTNAQGKKIENLSFLQLEHKIDSLVYNNANASPLIQFYIKKSKKENNLKALVYAYRYASQNPSEKYKVKYSDSAILVAKKINDNSILAEAYINKSTLLIAKNQHDVASNYLMLANRIAEKTNDNYLKYQTIYSIAQNYLYLGRLSDAKKEYEKCVNFFSVNLDKSQTYGKNYEMMFMYSLINLIDINSKLNQFSDNEILLKKAFQYIKENKSNFYYAYFISCEGTNAYFLKNYFLAIEKLKKAQTLYQDSWPHYTEIFYIGMSYWQLGNKKEAVKYFEKLDKEYYIGINRNPQYRPAYELLIEYYASKNNTDKQLEYINKLMSLDKSYEKNYKYLFAKIHKEYDTQKLIEEKNNIENSLKIHQYLTLFVIIISIVLISFSTYKYFQIQRRYKERFEQIISQKKTEIEKIPDTIVEEDKTLTPKIAGLSESTITYILEQLEIFEKEQQFLDYKITQKLLSEKLGTNPTYLSKIINVYKEKNFSNYLNDLRLEYVVELLKTEHKYLNRDIKELANIAGFTNAEAFSDNFQRKFEIKPSYFIKMMKENIKTSSL
ncbi:helix-turn-helix domain-containing protein [Cloacibacterium normanense]|uniref:Tetratricopeptide repeat family protein n=1 Tax=Cloacibacterium normanense TaxID=237258 RepID=A0A1E5UDL2_9FLAO|nr:helix-turn-helix domain-containing protein [Cloacibacterium normanense]AZI69343.1 helix-turn-helix domain-containing protein [Cloacibacterium normanense]OEL10908.1 tetratricopeptide repeat family protein [Cloacibacterium normanense]SDO47084.1 AraC-type DNA-binding protein [Cloacibacterium normanense]